MNLFDDVPLTKRMTELRFAVQNLIARYRQANLHTNPNLMRRSDHYILHHVVGIPSFDKHGDRYLAKDPFVDQVHRPPCNFVTWGVAFERELKLDPGEFLRAAENYSIEFDRAELSALPNIDKAVRHVTALFDGAQEGLTIAGLDDLEALGAFLTRHLYEEGLSFRKPSELLRDIAAISVVIQHAIEKPKRSELRADRIGLWRSDLLVSVFGSYFAYQVGRRGEMIRYVRRMDRASDGAGSYFGKHRKILAQFHIDKDQQSLEEVIRRDIAGHAEFPGYRSMALGHLANALLFAVDRNMPLDGTVPGYGGSIDASHERLRNAEQDQGTVFGVFAHTNHAMHLSQQGHFDRALKILDDYATHWKRIGSGREMGAVQNVAILRGRATVYRMLFRQGAGRPYLDAWESVSRRAKELCEASGLRKDYASIIADHATAKALA